MGGHFCPSQVAPYGASTAQASLTVGSYCSITHRQPVRGCCCFECRCPGLTLCGQCHCCGVMESEFTDGFRWVVAGFSASSCFSGIWCLFQIHRHKKGKMIKALQNKTVQNNSKIKRNCCLVLTVCMFIIKIKLNNVHNKHNKQHKLMLSNYN